MTTHKIESAEGRRIGDTIEIPNFAARIEESRRVNKIREKIGKIPENGVLCAADDFFGIRGDDNKDTIDVEFEVVEDVDS